MRHNVCLSHKGSIAVELPSPTDLHGIHWCFEACGDTNNAQNFKQFLVWTFFCSRLVAVSCVLIPNSGELPS